MPGLPIEGLGHILIIGHFFNKPRLKAISELSGQALAQPRSLKRIGPARYRDCPFKRANSINHNSANRKRITFRRIVSFSARALPCVARSCAFQESF